MSTGFNQRGDACGLCRRLGRSCGQCTGTDRTVGNGSVASAAAAAEADIQIANGAELYELTTALSTVGNLTAEQAARFTDAYVELRAAGVGAGDALTSVTDVAARLQQPAEPSGPPPVPVPQPDQIPSAAQPATAPVPVPDPAATQPPPQPQPAVRAVYTGDKVCHIDENTSAEAAEDCSRHEHLVDGPESDEAFAAHLQHNTTDEDFGTGWVPTPDQIHPDSDHMQLAVWIDDPDEADLVEQLVTYHANSQLRSPYLHRDKSTHPNIVRFWYDLTKSRSKTGVLVRLNEYPLNAMLGNGSDEKKDGTRTVGPVQDHYMVAYEGNA